MSETVLICCTSSNTRCLKFEQNVRENLTTSCQLRYQTFVKCSDDGTALAYAASHYFHKNLIFKNPYTGENAIPDKAISSSFNITRSGLETVSSSYVKIGEIMFFNLGGEEMSVVFSNIGDKNGSDKKEWVIIPGPSNF